MSRVPVSGISTIGIAVCVEHAGLAVSSKRVDIVDEARTALPIERERLVVFGVRQEEGRLPARDSGQLPAAGAGAAAVALAVLILQDAIRRPGRQQDAWVAVGGKRELGVAQVVPQADD